MPKHVHQLVRLLLLLEDGSGGVILGLLLGARGVPVRIGQQTVALPKLGIGGSTTYIKLTFFLCSW